MERNSPAVNFVAFLLVAVLVFPLTLTVSAMLHSQAHLSFVNHGHDFYHALKSSLALGFLASLGAMVLGFIFFLAVLFRPRFFPHSGYLLWPLIVPLLMPPIIPIGQFLNLASQYSQGFSLVLVYQVLVHSGIFAMWFHQKWVQKGAVTLQLAKSFNPSHFQIVNVLWGVVRREIVAIHFLVFSSVITGLNAILSLGGGRVFTIEVFTFELVKISQMHSLALVVSLLQSFILFVGAYYLVGSHTFKKWKVSRREDVRLRSPFVSTILMGFWFCFVYTFFFSGFIYFPKAIQQLQGLDDFWNLWFSKAPLSLLLAFCVASLGILLSLLAFVVSAYNRAIIYFIWSLGTVSGVVLVMGSFVVFEEWIWSYFVLVLNTLYFPFLFRFIFSTEVQKWKSQRQLAESMGVGLRQIITKLFVKTYRFHLVALFTLMWAWTLGEYVFIKMIAVSESTWGLILSSLLSGFYYELGVAMNFLLLLFGLLPVFVFILISRNGRYDWLRLKK